MVSPINYFMFLLSPKTFIINSNISINYVLSAQRPSYTITRFSYKGLRIRFVHGFRFSRQGADRWSTRCYRSSGALCGGLRCVVARRFMLGRYRDEAARPDLGQIVLGGAVISGGALCLGRWFRDAHSRALLRLGLQLLVQLLYLLLFLEIAMGIM